MQSLQHPNMVSQTVPVGDGGPLMQLKSIGGMKMIPTMLPKDYRLRTDYRKRMRKVGDPQWEVYATQGYGHSLDIEAGKISKASGG